MGADADMRSTLEQFRAALVGLAFTLAALLGALVPASAVAQGGAPSALSAYVVLPDPDDDDDDRGDRGDRDEDEDRGDRRDRDEDEDEDRGDRRDRDEDEDRGDRRDREDDEDEDRDSRRDRDRDEDSSDRDSGDRDSDSSDREERSPDRRPATVAAPPPAPHTPAPAPRSTSALTAVVRIRGRVTRRGVRLTLLGVRAPRGARVLARCLGKRCTVRRQAATTRSAVSLRRFHRHFRAGTVLVVRVTMPGRVGKFTRFTIRRGRPPLRRDLCLAPGARRPMNCS
jgi:hypothetical protein